MTTVGLIGLGRMGTAMACRLAEAGHHVAVFNRTSRPYSELRALGATFCESPVAVTRTSELVLTALSTPEAVEATYEFLATAATAGQVFVDHSTVGLPTTIMCCKSIRARGADYLDAPVSGGPGRARAGRLAIMVGGERSVFDRCLPVLRALGSTVEHCGPTGAGTGMKLVNQLLVGVHALAAAEATRLGGAHGLSRQQLATVLGASAGSSAMLLRRLEPPDASGPSAAAPLRLLAKDLRLVLEAARSRSQSLPMCGLASAIVEALVAAGQGESDLSRLELPPEAPAHLAAAE